MVKIKEMQAIRDYTIIRDAIELFDRSGCLQTSQLYRKKLAIINKLSLLADELHKRFEVEF